MRHSLRARFVSTWLLAITVFACFQVSVQAQYEPPYGSAAYRYGQIRATPDDPFMPNTYVNYRYLLPQNYNSASTTGYPVVIYLHGLGHEELAPVPGNATINNKKQLEFNSQYSLVTPEQQQIFPCFFILPVREWRSWRHHSKVLGEILQQLQDEGYKIDRDRVILTGLSDGGGGTVACASEYPGYYAAAVPLSPTIPQYNAQQLATIPTWFFTAANDTVTPPGNADSIVNALRLNGGSVNYTRYATGGHQNTVWGAAYQMPLLARWMAMQRRGLPEQENPSGLAITTPPGGGNTYVSSTNPQAFAGTTQPLSGISNPGTLTVHWNIGSPSYPSNPATATGTTNWSVAPVNLNTTGVTSLQVIAKGTSWSTLEGNTFYSRTVNVTYSPGGNTDPRANAGNDRTVTLPATVTISGATAEDDQQPGTSLGIVWAQEGSSPTVQITDENTLTPTFTFPSAGTYVFRLTVTDAGNLTDSDTMEVVVSDPPPPPPSGGSGTTVFSQDFNSASTVAAFFNASAPGANQFNDISSSASSPSGWSYDATNQRLKLVHTADSQSGGFRRSTNLTGVTTAVSVAFDLQIGNFDAWGSAVEFYLGQYNPFPAYNSSWINPSHSTALLRIEGHGPGNYALSANGTGNSGPIGSTVSKRITWAVNSGSTQINYTAPNGSTEELPGNALDVWVGNDQVLENKVRESDNVYLSSTSLTQFFAAFKRKGDYYIDNLVIKDLLTSGSEYAENDLTGEFLIGTNIGANSGGSSGILQGGETWEVNGSGTGLAGSADSFHLESDGTQGNFVMVARMKSLTALGAAPRAGLMARDSTAPGSRMLALATTSGSAYKVIKRTTANATSSETTPTQTYNYPHGWVLLERIGNILSASVSGDGETFTEVDSASFASLPAELEIGLFASSGTTGTVAKAQMDSFVIEQGTGLFKQNFSLSANVPDYVSASPTANQLNNINAGGPNSWEIIDGALKINRVSGSSNVGFTRHSDIIGPNSAIVIEFDISMSTSTNWTDMMKLVVGSLSANGNYAGYIVEANTTATLALRADGTNKYRFCINDDTTGSVLRTASTVPVHVVWYINSSGGDVIYDKPDGSGTRTLQTNQSAVWVNGVQEFNGAHKTKPSSFTSTGSDFFTYFKGTAEYTIDNFTVRTLP